MNLFRIKKVVPAEKIPAPTPAMEKKLTPDEERLGKLEVLYRAVSDRYATLSCEMHALQVKIHRNKFAVGNVLCRKLDKESFWGERIGYIKV